MNFAQNGESDGQRMLVSTLDKKLFLFDVSAKTTIKVLHNELGLILDASFLSDTEFFTVGVGHFAFRSTDTFEPQSREMEDRVILCVEKCADMVFVGFDNGIVQKHSERKLEKSVRAHEGPVDVLALVQNVLLSGGKDCCLTASNVETLERVVHFDLAKMFPDLNYPSVRAIQFMESEQKLLIGTAGSEIVELWLSSMVFDHLLLINRKRVLMSGPFAPCLEKNNLTLGFESFHSH